MNVCRILSIINTYFFNFIGLSKMLILLLLYNILINDTLFVCQFSFIYLLFRLDTRWHTWAFLGNILLGMSSWFGNHILYVVPSHHEWWWLVLKLEWTHKWYPIQILDKNIAPPINNLFLKPNLVIWSNV